MKYPNTPSGHLERLENTIPRANAKTFAAVLAVLASFSALKPLVNNLDYRPYSKAQSGEPMALTCAREAFQEACDGGANGAWLNDKCSEINARIKEAVDNQANRSSRDAALDAAVSERDYIGSDESWSCAGGNQPHFAIEKKAPIAGMHQ